MEETKLVQAPWKMPASQHWPDIKPDDTTASGPIHPGTGPSHNPSRLSKGYYQRNLNLFHQDGNGDAQWKCIQTIFSWVESHNRDGSMVVGEHDGGEADMNNALLAQHLWHRYAGPGLDLIEEAVREGPADHGKSAAPLTDIHLPKGLQAKLVFQQLQGLLDAMPTLGSALPKDSQEGLETPRGVDTETAWAIVLKLLVWRDTSGKWQALSAPVGLFLWHRIYMLYREGSRPRASNTMRGKGKKSTQAEIRPKEELGLRDGNSGPKLATDIHTSRTPLTARDSNTNVGQNRAHRSKTTPAIVMRTKPSTLTDRTNLTVYLSSPVLGKSVRFVHGITTLTTYDVLYAQVVKALNFASGVAIQVEVGLLVPGNDGGSDHVPADDPLGRVKQGYTVPAMFLVENEGDWNVFIEDQVVGIGGTLVALRVQVIRRFIVD